MRGSRVNPMVPAAVAVAGLVLIGFGPRWVGVGLIIGAALAYVNGLVLSRRVDLAADSGNVAGAFMVMQMGLVLTLTIAGIATYLMTRLSVSMAVAAAIAFAVTQTALLVVFYRTAGRVPATEGEPS